MYLGWQCPTVHWNWRSYSGQRRSLPRPTINWAASFECQRELHLNVCIPNTKRKGLFVSGLGAPWCKLAEHCSSSLRCRLRAKLEIHLPSTSCTDYLERMFLIHLHITHPGVLQELCDGQKEPKESFIIFKTSFSMLIVSQSQEATFFPLYDFQTRLCKSKSKVWPWLRDYRSDPEDWWMGFMRSGR